jgi:hypothetical protein
MNIYVDPGQLGPMDYIPDASRIHALLRLRKEAADAVEQLIGLLDQLDGDPDLEPYLAQNGNYVTDDREADPAEALGHPGDLLTDDSEPSLGWTIDGFLGGDGDLEEGCEDEGAQCDDEGDQEQDSDPGFLDWAPYSPPAPIRSSIDPSLLPGQYFMTGEGACLDPIIKDGDRVLVSKTEPVRPGDFVAIFFNRKFVPRGEHQVLMKRLIVDGRDGSCTLEDGRATVMAD